MRWDEIVELREEGLGSCLGHGKKPESRKIDLSESEELILDRLAGEDLLRGVRLEKVMKARLRILSAGKSRASSAQDTISESWAWNDRKLPRLYPA